jgi:hypothetical protein
MTLTDQANNISVLSDIVGAKKIGTENARIPNCWENDTDCFVNQHGAFYAYPRDYYEPVATD